MAENGKLIGIGVLALFVIVALAYIFLFNHQPDILRGGTTTISNYSSTGTKIVVYNSIPTNTAKNNTARTTPTTSVIFNQGVYDVPITLTNSQLSPTTNGLQIMVVVPSINYSSYIGSGWSNIEFTTGPLASGNVISAWVETNATPTAKATVVWLKLPEVIYDQNSRTIYMDFMSFNTLSSSGPTGEAPQLSSEYAAYDDGALVFNFYDNFNGRSLNTKLWSSASGFAYNPITVNDGLTIGKPTSNPNSGYSAMLSIQTFGRGAIDFYGTLLANSTQPYSQDVGLLSEFSSQACSIVDIGSFSAAGFNGLQTIDSYCNAKYVKGLSFGHPEIYSILVNGSIPINATAMINYSDPITSSFPAMFLPQTIGFINQGNGGNLGPIYWIRQRSYPPNGVFPAVSFGKLQ